MKKGLPEDDVFRWKCVAIIMSALEGASTEDIKNSLWNWVFGYGGIGDDGPSYDPELMRKYFAWEKENGPVHLEPRVTQREWRALAESLMVAMKAGETLASVKARFGLPDELSGTIPDGERVDSSGREDP